MKNLKIRVSRFIMSALALSLVVLPLVEPNDIKLPW